MVKSRAITVAALCLVVIALSGCSNSKPPASVKVINKEQFEVLRKARSELGAFIQDASTALNPTYPLATRMEKLDVAVAKYDGKFPKPEFAPADQLPADFSRRLAGTSTGELLKFNKTVRWNVKKGGKAYDADEISAWYVASDYLAAINYLYGLQDFEKYIVDHTIEEGTKSNPVNPMENMESGMKVFGSMGFGGGGISCNTTVDPVTGFITYRILTDSDIVEEMPLNQAENAFITGALRWLREGSDLLLDSTKV